MQAHATSSRMRSEFLSASAQPQRFTSSEVRAAQAVACARASKGDGPALSTSCPRSQPSLRRLRKLACAGIHVFRAVSKAWMAGT